MSENLDLSLVLPTAPELSEQDLEVVSAGKVNSPGGIGGPFSGLGVRPGLGWGAPGLGLRRGIG